MRMRTIAAADLTVTRLRRVLQALRASLPMPVGPAAIQALAMSLHELVTNAAKYGALSKPDGQVAVSWDNRSNGDAAASLVLVWQERGGPPAAAKVSPDYGTSLIRDLIPYELGGAVDLAFAPDGVNCRIELPLERI